MAKRYHETNIQGDKTRFENWDQPESTMPEGDLGDSRQGIDKQIKGDSIKKIKIKPRLI